MKILYFISTIPRLILDAVLPFNPKRYRPSSEWERDVSQEVRNKARLASYRAKRLVVTR